MTKVFVTVGTTRFPSLVEYFDGPTIKCEVTLQTADPDFVARNAAHFPFSEAVQEHYDWADVVVTHAGAGSVYSLLEAQRRIIVVPNIDRSDKHQLDLAGYVRQNRFAMVVDRLDEFESIDEMIMACLEYDTRPYVKTPFFMGELLLSLLRRGGLVQRDPGSKILQSR
jgi:UDP-N-acetylglucosamine transferase subunit ALG13